MMVDTAHEQDVSMSPSELMGLFEEVVGRAEIPDSYTHNDGGSLHIVTEPQFKRVYVFPEIIVDHMNFFYTEEHAGPFTGVIFSVKGDIQLWRPHGEKNIPLRRVRAVVFCAKCTKKNGQKSILLGGKWVLECDSGDPVPIQTLKFLP
jgi:hypothetical protein